MARSLADRMLPRSTRIAIEKVLQQHNKYRADDPRRTAGRKTQQDRRQVILLSYAQLWQMGFKLSAPTSLREKHIEALVDLWDRQGSSASNLHTRLSMLRALAAWLGKKDVVKDITDYLPKERVARSLVAKESKAWSNKGIEVGAMIEQAYALDALFGLYLEAQSQLGLRVKESIEMSPAKCVIDDDTIEIFQGTKGGRPRQIKLETTEQRRVFAKARKQAALNKSGKLRWPGLTWKQAQAKFYYLSRRLGLTKADCGATPHGGRHEFVKHKYPRVTEGIAVPLDRKEGEPIRIDRETHLRAAMNVSRELGHGRFEIFATYGGSYGHKLRQAGITVKPFTWNQTSQGAQA